MLNQENAIEILNILGPFNGRRIRADIVRNNLNIRLVRPVSETQFMDMIREMKERGWVVQRVDDFGNELLGITEEGQLIREKNGQ